MEYSCVLQRQMNLENVLNERSQAQKFMYCMIQNIQN